MPSNTATNDSWPQRFRDKPWLWTLTGLLLAVSAVVVVWSIVNALLHADRQHAWYALLGGTGGFAATALGALIALALREISSKVQDVMLGFAGGMMLAASTFSLLLP
ncbi:MAG: ZIP family metal transporter, partial [Proteobacteria bacterium]